MSKNGMHVSVTLKQIVVSGGWVQECVGRVQYLKVFCLEVNNDLRMLAMQRTPETRTCVTAGGGAELPPVVTHLSFEFCFYNI
jgi:hypothetical protein